MNEILFKKNWQIWDKNVLEEIEGVLDHVSSQDSVCISFKALDEFKTENMPVLLVLIYRINRITGKQIMLTDVNDDDYNYLYNRKFFFLTQVKCRRFSAFPNDHNVNSIIPITEISKKEAIDDFTRNNVFRLQTCKLPNPLFIFQLILELLYNGEEHGRGDLDNKKDKLHLYTFCDEWDDKLCLAVVDFGIGFLSSLLQNKGYEKKITSHKNAIRLVLEKHISRRNINGGNGYITIEQAIDMYNGKLLISSGDATVVYRNKKVYDDIKEHRVIQGSVVYIELSKMQQT